MKNLIAIAFVIFTTTSLFSQVLSQLTTKMINIDSLANEQVFLQDSLVSVITIRPIELKLKPIAYLKSLSKYMDSSKYLIEYSYDDEEYIEHVIIKNVVTGENIKTVWISFRENTNDIIAIQENHETSKNLNNSILGNAIFKKLNIDSLTNNQSFLQEGAVNITLDDNIKVKQVPSDYLISLTQYSDPAKYQIMYYELSEGVEHIDIINIDTNTSSASITLTRNVYDITEINEYKY
jgi:hypothetical protein